MELLPSSPKGPSLSSIPEDRSPSSITWLESEPLGAGLLLHISLLGVFGKQWGFIQCLWRKEVSYEAPGHLVSDCPFQIRFPALTLRLYLPVMLNFLLFCKLLFLTSKNIRSRKPYRKTMSFRLSQTGSNASSDPSSGRLLNPSKPQSLFLKTGENETYTAGLLRWLNEVFTWKHLTVPRSGEGANKCEVSQDILPHFSVECIASYLSDPAHVPHRGSLP